MATEPIKEVADKIVEDEHETAGTSELYTENTGSTVVENNKSIAENPSGIIHKGYGLDDVRQQMVQRAYELGGIEFVKMIECENGQRNPFAVGDGGHAHGLCQMNTNYHKLPQEYFDDWGYQLEYCYQKWSTGTRFYGPSRKIKGVKCSTYVSDRFEIKS